MWPSIATGFQNFANWMEAKDDEIVVIIDLAFGWGASQYIFGVGSKINGRHRDRFRRGEFAGVDKEQQLHDGIV